VCVNGLMADRAVLDDGVKLVVVHCIRYCASKNLSVLAGSGYVLGVPTNAECQRAARVTEARVARQGPSSASPAIAACCGSQLESDQAEALAYIQQACAALR